MREQPPVIVPTYPTRPVRQPALASAEKDQRLRAMERELVRIGELVVTLHDEIKAFRRMT
jgi:hypothetical protein